MPLRTLSLLLVSLSIFALSSGELNAGRSFDRPGSASRSLVLPTPPGQTWYVCQGYDGEISHQGLPALDVSIDRNSAGPRGCMSGSRYSSAGSVASSPGAGTAFRWPGCCGNDFVCVDLEGGGSIAIGHLSNRVASGTRVEMGSRIGTVAWPDSANGNYAHIHVQAHPTPQCTEGSDPVAFERANGFKWACTRDLPYTGKENQYSGMGISRCSAPDASDSRKTPFDEGERGVAPQRNPKGVGAPSGRSKLKAIVVQVIRAVGQAIAPRGG